jgi:hypothetical protein
MIRSEIRMAVVAAAGAALMSAVVACSSSAATDEPATASSTTSFTAKAPSSFIQCMTDNGVSPPPDGGPGTPPAPPGVDQQTWDKAGQVCASPAPPTP